MEACEPSSGVLEQELIALRHRVAVLETAAARRQQAEDALRASASNVKPSAPSTSLS